ncbi:MAG: 5-formyltetrahydrofolate cyclo-ligase [Bacteroidota bacterium]
MTKEVIRKQSAAYRRGLTDAVHQQLSASICTRVAKHEAFRRARTVHLYWPMLAHREVDTRPLIQAAWDEGKRVVVPVVARFGRNVTTTPRLRHIAITPDTPLAPNRWGIPEPQAGPTVPLADLDLVVVPALAFDRAGYRVGHGFGYYDEFLGSLSVHRVGLCYAACLHDAVPHERHDIAVDNVMTELETI